MTTKYDCIDIVTDHDPAEQFVERLATFSLVEWLSVAAAVTKTASARADATEALDQVIAKHGLAFDAWSIGDDVETAFHCSTRASGASPSPRDCALLRIAREAGTKAAVALFAGSLLPAAHSETLYRPFASLVPQPAGSNSPRPAAVRPSLKLVDPTPRERRRGTA